MKMEKVRHKLSNLFLKTNLVFRFFGQRLGGFGPRKWRIGTRFFERKNSLANTFEGSLAATNTVQSLGKQGQTVLLRVDNAVTFWFLVKGGEKKSI